MNERLFPGEEVIPNEVNDDDNGSMEENESNISLQEKLKIRLQELERCKASVKSSQKVLPSKQFSNELDIFEATGEMTTRIKSLFDALKTIPPTSIESERAFSAVGLFVTKLRTRLSDKSINNLSFLRAYYKRK